MTEPLTETDIKVIRNELRIREGNGAWFPAFMAVCDLALKGLKAPERVQEESDYAPVSLSADSPEFARAIKGDGVTDDTAAIQAATNDLAARRPHAERERVIRECANVAMAHKGSAAKRRKDRRQSLGSFAREVQEEIRAEERGEDIAAEIIAAAILALAQQPEPKG